MSTDFNYMVGGEAGHGVQSLGMLVAKVFAKAGYHVFADQDYESRIRGGHNFFRIRIKDTPVAVTAGSVDVLVALDRQTMELHMKDLVHGGVCLFNTDRVKDVADASNLVGIPLERIAFETVGDRIVANTVALGGALAIVSHDIGTLDEVLAQHFGRGKVADNNLIAARAGYDFVRRQHAEFPRIGPGTSNTSRLLLNGNDALSLGAIAAGCKFMSAYPMTPTTSIMEYMASKSQAMDIVMVHAEDEIAAVHMAIGASYAGARSMTATSGGGFCLMVEGLGLAGMTETPIVIVEGQRPGPAIGLPTRTEQGDLQFVLNAHHGDFPRAVLAPATIEDCFWTMIRAFNLADRYQLPVIVLTDHHLASSYGTVERFDLTRVTVDRGSTYSDSDGDPSDYRRHRITQTGISPRAFPGLGKALVVTDSDEHDEHGHPIEDAGTRTAQMDKRLRKLIGLKHEIARPRYYGAHGADTLLIGWGSTYGALCEAVDTLRRDMSIGLLHINELWPFPVAAVADAIDNARTTFVVENNATGQLARLIRMETGKDVTGKVLKYDGRPFSPAGIIEALKNRGS